MSDFDFADFVVTKGGRAGTVTNEGPVPLEKIYQAFKARLYAETEVKKVPGEVIGVDQDDMAIRRPILILTDTTKDTNSEGAE